MTATLLTPPPTSGIRVADYRPQPESGLPADTAASHWPSLEVGTGGTALEAFVLQSFGYHRFAIIMPAPVVEDAPFAKLMRQVKAGFGRTMSRLPEAFGVSRQTLYNWLEGETPKAIHQERIRQLAEAAAVFAELGIKPTPAMLDRTVAQGKTFLQLMAAGANGKETAKKLIRIVQRSTTSRDKLDALLAGRKAKLDASDIGAPSFDESD